MVHLIVINLKRRIDRWESLQTHLNIMKPKLSFIESIHRLDAVEGRAVGCMLSHAKALQWAKCQHWSEVLVVEDDVRFSDDIDKLWFELQSNLSKRPWSIVFGASVRIRPRDIKVVNETLLALKHPDGIFTGTHCMLYHSSIYDKVIQLIEEESRIEYPYHLDLLLSSRINTPEMPVLLSVPYLALFTEQDISDVRVGKDTSVDYQNITEAHEFAKRLTKQ